LHKPRRTNVIEVNHWAKVANKTANINVQNRPKFIRQLTASLHIKNSKYQKGDIAQQYIVI